MHATKVWLGRELASYGDASYGIQILRLHVHENHGEFVFQKNVEHGACLFADCTLRLTRVVEIILNDQMTEHIKI